MFKKVTLSDKALENINTRLDTFASAIKNEHSFNNMLESQLSQLASGVPPMEKGKASSQLEDLETANLVDIHNASH